MPCRCCKRRRVRAPLPEPEQPDASTVLACAVLSIAFVLAVVPNNPLKWLAAIASPIVTVAFLNNLLKPMPPNIKDTAIVGATERDGVTFYEVSVSAGRPLQHYTILRRYNAFDELREDLDPVSDASFPPKSNSWFSKLSKEAVESRQRGLEHWLKRAVAQVKLRNSAEELFILASFLEVPAERARSLKAAVLDFCHTAFDTRGATAVNETEPTRAMVSQALDKASVPNDGFAAPAPSAPIDAQAMAESTPLTVTKTVTARASAPVLA